MASRKPLGVTIFSVFFIATGVLSLAILFSILFSVYILRRDPLSLFVVPYLIPTSVLIPIGIGLLRLRKWARISILVASILIVCFVSILFLLAAQRNAKFYHLHREQTSVFVVSILVAVGTFSYFGNPRIKRHFETADKNT